MANETPSIKAVVVAATPSPEEDRTARLGAEAKDEMEMVALHAAEKAAWAEEEEDDINYLGKANDNEADAREFRDTWNRIFSDVYGCFEDTSELFSLSLSLFLRSDQILVNLSLINLYKLESVLNL